MANPVDWMALPRPKDAVNTTNVLPDTLDRAFAGVQQRVASIASRPNKAAETNGSILNVADNTTASMMPQATKVFRLTGMSLSCRFNNIKSFSRVSA